MNLLIAIVMRERTAIKCAPPSEALLSHRIQHGTLRRCRVTGGK